MLHGVQSPRRRGWEGVRRQVTGVSVKIDKYEPLHGAALAQLTTDDRFTSLNRASDRYGHYLINDSSRVWTKYSSAAGPRWQFTFTADDVAHIWYDGEDHPDSMLHVVLVCGSETICPLNLDELWTVLDFDENESSQAIVVSAPAGKSMRVKGPIGRLTHTVPHNAFPTCVLGGNGRISGESGVTGKTGSGESVPPSLSVRLREIAVHHYRPRTRHLGPAEFTALVEAAEALETLERFVGHVDDARMRGIEKAVELAEGLRGDI